MRLLVGLFIFMFTSLSFAEYRVYQLKITDTKTKRSREVLSTLMPQAYIAYHPILSTEMVELVDHWMCWKRSDGFQRYCAKPIRPPAPEAAPESTVKENG